MSPMRYVVGTAGHIDHGKTALIRALTGADTDRFPEEKSRGITIDIGFAALDLSSELHLSFIDVPGHERFIKNMLAGIGGIDVVMLVVAADESVMPQTREHFEICSLLGIRRGLVVLSKIDLVSEDLRELAELEVREYLEGSFLDGAPLVPVSSKTGQGIEELKEALQQVVEGMEPKDAGGWVRLPVDRSFSIRGFGTVVTGTLFSGTLHQGDELEIVPGRTAVKLRRVEVHGEESPQAVAGQRVALNLQGVDTSQVRRGQVLASPQALLPSRLVDVRMQLLASAPAVLKNLSRVRYHHGTAEVLARVKLLGSHVLQPGEECMAQLRLETDHVALPGDRFIIRRYSPSRTIGGGTVLDPAPRKHRGLAEPAARYLEAMEKASPDDRVVLLVDSMGSRGCSLWDLQARLGLPLGRMRPSLSQAEAAGRLVVVGDGPAARCLSRAALDEFQRQVLQQLGRHHQAHPLDPGLGKEELRVRVFGDAPVEVFRYALELQQQQQSLVVEGDRVRLASHQLRLTPEEEEAQQLIEAAFLAGGLNPPGLAEVARQNGLAASQAEALHRVLLRSGRLVQVRSGLLFHCQALEDLKQRLLHFRNQNETIDIASFKELSGTTRKNAIPLLEYLDAQHVTCRRGSERVILPPPQRVR
ncbi:MAG: selenocysteine-specific translation elongation factor [Acidobacteria bacterium]|nr:MAG: selenocysteine-specific translation elongation factor [Acidobacteriota bacterium]